MKTKEQQAKEFAQKIPFPDDDDWTIKQRYLGFIAGFNAANQDVTLISEEMDELVHLIRKRIQIAGDLPN